MTSPCMLYLLKALSRHPMMSSFTFWLSTWSKRFTYRTDDIFI